MVPSARKTERRLNIVGYLTGKCLYKPSICLDCCGIQGIKVILPQKEYPSHHFHIFQRPRRLYLVLWFTPNYFCLVSTFPIHVTNVYCSHCPFGPSFIGTWDRSVEQIQHFGTEKIWLRITALKVWDRLYDTIVAGYYSPLWFGG